MIILIQDGIQPMWEDEKNKYGGRWLLNVDKKGPRPPIIDTYWVETVRHVYFINRVLLCVHIHTQRAQTQRIQHREKIHTHSHTHTHTNARMHTPTHTHTRYANVHVQHRTWQTHNTYTLDKQLIKKSFFSS